MKIGPLRTIALCTMCAALAGAGSAALAADEGAPATTAASPGPAGQTLVMRKCVLDPANTAGEGEGEETCTVTSGGTPPPGGKPPFGECVKVESGTVDKAADDATKKKTAALAEQKCKATSDAAPPPGGKPPLGGCVKVELGKVDKAAIDDATKKKMAAIAKAKAATAGS
jgi:hypothetical protein